jgi:hypothetical protein
VLLGVGSRHVAGLVDAGTLPATGKRPGAKRARQLMIPLAAVLKRMQTNGVPAHPANAVGIVVDERRGTRVVRRSRPITIAPRSPWFGKSKTEIREAVRKFVGGLR